MLIASCLEGKPKKLEAGDRGSEPVRCPDLLQGKPDHPCKVKSYCRPEVGGRESGPGNVTDLLHREARLLWKQGSLRRKKFCRSVADDWCVWSR